MLLGVAEHCITQSGRIQLVLASVLLQTTIFRQAVHCSIHRKLLRTYFAPAVLRQKVLVIDLGLARTSCHLVEICELILTSLIVVYLRFCKLRVLWVEGKPLPVSGLVH